MQLLGLFCQWSQLCRLCAWPTIGDQYLNPIDVGAICNTPSITSLPLQVLKKLNVDLGGVGGFADHVAKGVFIPYELRPQHHRESLRLSFEIDLLLSGVQLSVFQVDGFPLDR